MRQIIYKKYYLINQAKTCIFLSSSEFTFPRNENPLESIFRDQFRPIQNLPAADNLNQFQRDRDRNPNVNDPNNNNNSNKIVKIQREIKFRLTDEINLRIRNRTYRFSPSTMSNRNLRSGNFSDSEIKNLRNPKIRGRGQSRVFCSPLRNEIIKTENL